MYYEIIFTFRPGSIFLPNKFFTLILSAENEQGARAKLKSFYADASIIKIIEKGGE